MFDKNCSTYWCNKCGRFMEVDYSMSNEFGIVLKCTRSGSYGISLCEYREFFVSVDVATFEDVTDGSNILDFDLNIPVGIVDGSLLRLGLGVLDRSENASEGDVENTSRPSKPVEGCQISSGDMEEGERTPCNDGKGGEVRRGRERVVEREHARRIKYGGADDG